MSKKYQQPVGETFYVVPPTSAAPSSKPCIFCFKNESENGSIPNRTKKEIKFVQQRFFTLQENFEEKLEPTRADDCTTEQKVIPLTQTAAELKVVSCLECFSIIDSYCDAYDKIKCLQMELNWKLVRLNKIMKCADQDISKICAFQDWCLLNGRKVEESMEFRRHFQNQCSLRNLKCFPRVEIGRVCTRNVKARLDNSTVTQEKYRLRGVPELSNTDQCQVDFALPSSAIIIKEENSNDDFNNSGIDDEVDSLSSHETDPDWFEDNDDEDYNEKVVRKTKKSPGKSKSKTVIEKAKKRVRNRKKKSVSKRTKCSDDENDQGIISCQKCKIVPRPQFNSFHALHAHQKYLHTNGYAVLSKAENSEILRLNEKDLKLAGIPTTILNCCSDYFPECTQKFLSIDELDNHLKYHGNFTCETCFTVKSNAVDMAHHELSHRKETRQSSVVTCGKCEYSTGLEEEFVNHYLEVHMNKPAIQATCLICQQRFKYVEQVHVLHYLNYHDLTRLEDPSSTGIQCVENGCSAYFLTEDQLQEHWRSIHSSSLTAIVSEETKIKNVKVRSKKATFSRMRKKYTNICEFCDKAFRLENQLKSHTWRYHVEDKWGDACGKVLLTEDGLTIDEFCAVTRDVCKICENVFGSKEQLDSHELHHGEFKCNFCSVVKKLATELAIHETVHIIDNIEGKESISIAAGHYKCPRCTFTTRKRPDYVDHFLETHLSLSSDRKKCPICRKPVPDELKTKSVLKGGSLRNWMVCHYMEVHDKTGLNPDSMSKCTLCPGYFRTAIQLDSHLRDVHGKHSFDCCDCGKIFYRREQLRSHRISVHKADPTTFPFLCSFLECGHRFETQVELEYHEVGAHNQENVGVQICPQCGKQCSGTSQLKAHIKVHEKEKVKKEELLVKPLICEQCGKSYENEKKLKKHRYKHKLAENRPKRAPQSESLVCEFCGKTCENKQQLKVHRWRHKGIASRNFVCSLCSKSFPTNYKLNLHSRVHTKEKPYSCPFCNAKFGFPQNVKAHITLKHKDKSANL